MAVCIDESAQHSNEDNINEDSIMRHANTSIINSADLLGRALLAAIFIISGIGKITGYAGAQGYMEAFGLPGMLLPLVIVAELGLGALLLVGFQTRLAALGLALFTLVAAFIFHFDLGDAGEQIQFLKNLAITGGLLIVSVHGAAGWSLDGRRQGA
jgi:putative oxidoreductase